MSNHEKGRFRDHDDTGATATANSNSNSNSNDEIEMKKNVDMHVCSDESSGTGIEIDDQDDEVKVQHEHSSSSDHDIFDGDGDGDGDGDEENDAENADARNDKVVDEDGGIDPHKNHHRLTICMPCRTECGYCHGDRLYTLAIDNPSRIVLEQEDVDEDEDNNRYVNVNGNGNYNRNIPNSFSCDNDGTNTCTKIPKKMMKKRVLIRRRHNRLHKRRDEKDAQTDGVSNKNGEEQIIESAETILDHSDTSYHHLEPEPDIVVLEIEQENENENENGNGTGTGIGTGTGKHKDKSTTKTPITKSTTSDAYALHFFSLSVQAYQSMINRGWRRSGNLLYKPKNWTSCCATLPIRLDVNLFDDCTNAPEREREREREPSSLSKDCKARCRRGGMSKSQKKVLKRWNKVLNGTGGLNSRSASAKTSNANTNTNGRRTGINENRTKSKVKGEGRLDDNVNTSTDNDTMKVESSGFNPKRQKHQMKLQTPNQNQQPKTISNSANTKRISKSQQNQQMQSYAKRILKQNNHDHPLILQLNKEIQTIVSQLLETNTDTTDTGISNNLENTNNGHLSSPPLSLSASQYNRILEKQCQLKLTRVSKSKYQDQHTRERRTSTSDAADGMNGLLEGTVISQASKSLTTVETEVHLSNSIGPSLHGISKGKMDQVHTSEAIVSHLNNSNLFAVFDDENGGDSQSDDHRDNTKSDRPNPWKNASVRIKEISLHEKSAHVHVVLMVSFGIDSIKDLNLDLDLQEITSSNVTCTASNETGSTRTPNNHEALGQSEANPQNEKTVDRLKENDIIREFIMTHYQSTLTKEEEESLAPPYKFTVRSISAQQSGRMPEVHQLYCRYQRSVHGDEDPYDCAARVDHNKDSKQVKTDTALQTDTTMEDMDHDADGANVEDNTKKAETQNALTKEDFRRLYPLYKDSCIEKIYKGYVLLPIMSTSVSLQNLTNFSLALCIGMMGFISFYVHLHCFHCRYIICTPRWTERPILFKISRTRQKRTPKMPTVHLI